LKLLGKIFGIDFDEGLNFLFHGTCFWWI